MRCKKPPALNSTKYRRRGPGPWPKGLMEEFRHDVITTLEMIRPATVRETYYEMLVQLFTGSGDYFYELIVRQLTFLRDGGIVDDEWVIDNLREVHQLNAYVDIPDFLNYAKGWFRIDPWKDQPQKVIVILEKDALVGQFRPITRDFRVPLCVIRGWVSRGFLANEVAPPINRGTTILALGDYDPSGMAIPQDAHRRLEEIVGYEIAFERLGLNREQIDEFGLLTFPTKKSDTRAVAFNDPESAELEALNPEMKRELLRNSIVVKIDPDLWAESERIEQGGQEELEVFLSTFSAFHKRYSRKGNNRR